MYVKAEKFAQGGRSVGRLDDGRIVFIDGLFPGEEGEISITEEKRDYCIAKALSVAVRSPDRRRSPCPFSSQCGGCSWIELDYNAQAKAKEELLRELFSDFPDIVFKDPVTGPEFGYRSRARFQYTTKNGKASLGFCAENSNRNVEITSCPVADAELNGLISSPPRLNAWELKNSELSCITTENGVLYDGGTGWIRVGDRRLPVSNRVFFQSNPGLLPSLIDYVVSLVKGPSVMDLYSGVGTFSAFLEDRYDVTAVEINKDCLSLARMHLKKTTFFTSAVEKWNPRVRSVDTVIVDPPRVGLDKAVPAMIASWKPSRIIYVSCYAPTQHRDMKRFEELGYRAESLKMYDFYAQTPHVESVVLMSRK
ncbi:MAG: class I SAM-dependent RNA methyltransferase [Spirochaetales bacterium]|nr:class I SAM-dependent RNA methyltransferase [Spirochaetales bacterium]